MSRPTCESLVERPSPQSGWTQWGKISFDGKDFTLLHGLESELPKESAYYYLAAAGVCEIEGQPRAGALLPTESLPPVAPDTLPPLSIAVPVAVMESQPEPITVATQTEQPWVWGIGVVLLLIIGGAAFTRARRKQTDTTPKPKGFTFNQGEDDNG